MQLNKREFKKKKDSKQPIPNKQYLFVLIRVVQFVRMHRIKKQKEEFKQS